MGDGDRQPPGDRNHHEHAAVSHPQSTSSTLGPRLHGRVRRLGAFPAHTKVARTIASMHGMWRIEPPGRGIAASAANTCGIYCVWGCSCGQAAPSLLNWVAGFYCLLCGSHALMFCNSSSKRAFAHVPYLCSIVCNTFGIFPPSFPVVFLVVNHCFRAHLPIYPCRVCNLPCIICHPTPPILRQPSARSSPSPLSVPLAQDIHRKNGVPIGPLCPESRHMRDGQPAPCVAPM